MYTVGMVVVLVMIVYMIFILQMWNLLTESALAPTNFGEYDVLMVCGNQRFIVDHMEQMDTNCVLRYK